MPLASARSFCIGCFDVGLCGARRAVRGDPNRHRVHMHPHPLSAQPSQPQLRLVTKHTRVSQISSFLPQLKVSATPPPHHRRHHHHHHPLYTDLPAASHLLLCAANDLTSVRRALACLAREWRGDRSPPTAPHVVDNIRSQCLCRHSLTVTRSSPPVPLMAPPHDVGTYPTPPCRAQSKVSTEISAW
jgi:hypothetical protein